MRGIAIILHGAESGQRNIAYNSDCFTPTFAFLGIVVLTLTHAVRYTKYVNMFSYVIT